MKENDRDIGDAKKKMKSNEIGAKLKMAFQNDSSKLANGTVVVHETTSLKSSALEECKSAGVIKTDRCEVLACYACYCFHNAYVLAKENAICVCLLDYHQNTRDHTSN